MIYTQQVLSTNEEMKRGPCTMSANLTLRNLAGPRHESWTLRPWQEGSQAAGVLGACPRARLGRRAPCGLPEQAPPLPPGWAGTSAVGARIWILEVDTGLLRIMG